MIANFFCLNGVSLKMKKCVLGFYNMPPFENMVLQSCTITIQIMRRTFLGILLAQYIISMQSQMKNSSSISSNLEGLDSKQRRNMYCNMLTTSNNQDTPSKDGHAWYVIHNVLLLRLNVCMCICVWSCVEDSYLWLVVEGI